MSLGRLRSILEVCLDDANVEHVATLNDVINKMKMRILFRGWKIVKQSTYDSSSDSDSSIDSSSDSDSSTDSSSDSDSSNSASSDSSSPTESDNQSSETESDTEYESDSDRKDEWMISNYIIANLMLGCYFEKITAKSDILTNMFPWSITYPLIDWTSSNNSMNDQSIKVQKHWKKNI